MLSPMPHSKSAPHADRVNEAVGAYLNAVGRGETPDLARFLADHADIAIELNSFFANQSQVGMAAGYAVPGSTSRSPTPGSPLKQPAFDPNEPTLTFKQQSAPSPKGVLRYFGDYELIQEIAHGGMGVVFKARQVTLNRIVAVKMILRGQLAGPEDVQRFHTEAEAAAQLDHPGIVPIYEVGEQDGQHYFSMAFVEGHSLAKRVAQGPLEPRAAAEIVRIVSEAVQYAHDKGVIHRDLKPGNILLDQESNPRVTDFGLAKLIESGSDLTGTGQILGTPSYMPPEQAAGKTDEIGPAADVYSLGAILYCLLTGRPPFQAASPMDTLLQVMNQEPAPPRRLNPAVPRDLETICLMCLRKETSNRYSTAGGLVDDLRRWLESKPILARPVSLRERVWLWCKRRPAVATLSAAVVVILVVGSLVIVERQDAVRSAGLVDSLVSADIAQLPQIMADLEGYRHRATPLLEALASRTPTSQDQRRAQLHARLALVAHDERHVPGLLEELLAGNPDYVEVIRGQLAPYQRQLARDLWRLLHEPQQTTVRRFRAGLALAAYAAESDQWTTADYALLAEQLVAANAEQQPRLRACLRPIRAALLTDLERIFADRAMAEGRQLGAANALVDFAANDAVWLARLLTVAAPAQFHVVYPFVDEARDAAAQKLLTGIVGEVPAAGQLQAERLALGQRRAAAAIALLRHGECEAALGALRVDDDPESLTQFVHRCRARGVLPAELLHCLDRTDKARQLMAGPARKIEDRVLFGLLLALGEFDLTDLPEETRSPFVARLANWHTHDAASGIHGATGWLLRHWQQDELAAAVDQTPLAYSPSREWFTLQIEPRGLSTAQTAIPAAESPFCLTFVVFHPGKHLIGSPPDEIDRLGSEQQHHIELTHPIAVSNREITWAQFNSSDGRRRHDAHEKQFGRKLASDEPVFGINWFEAITYCRWLTRQAGVPESGQCYGAPGLLPKDPQGNPADWRVDLAGQGFRLPTEAEWEVACRGGMMSQYSFGNDTLLLAHYGWFLENSEKWSHAAGRLRPNARGLFDVHGNLFEWCHDWFGDYPAGTADPIGTEKAADRVDRGGGWNGVAAFCRSGNRRWDPPGGRSISLGFRLAFTPIPPTE